MNNNQFQKYIYDSRNDNRDFLRSNNLYAEELEGNDCLEPRKIVENGLKYNVKEAFCDEKYLLQYDQIKKQCNISQMIYNSLSPYQRSIIDSFGSGFKINNVNPIKQFIQNYKEINVDANLKALSDFIKNKSSFIKKLSEEGKIVFANIQDVLLNQDKINLLQIIKKQKLHEVLNGNNDEEKAKFIENFFDIRINFSIGNTAKESLEKFKNAFFVIFNMTNENGKIVNFTPLQDYLKPTILTKEDIEIDKIAEKNCNIISQDNKFDDYNNGYCYMFALVRYYLTNNDFIKDIREFKKEQKKKNLNNVFDEKFFNDKEIKKNLDKMQKRFEKDYLKPDKIKNLTNCAKDFVRCIFQITDDNGEIKDISKLHTFLHNDNLVKERLNIKEYQQDIAIFKPVIAIAQMIMSEYKEEIFNSFSWCQYHFEDWNDHGKERKADKNIKLNMNKLVNTRYCIRPCSYYGIGNRYENFLGNFRLSKSKMPFLHIGYNENAGHYFNIFQDENGYYQMAGCCNQTKYDNIDKVIKYLKDNCESFTKFFGSDLPMFLWDKEQSLADKKPIDKNIEKIREKEMKKVLGLKINNNIEKEEKQNKNEIKDIEEQSKNKKGCDMEEENIESGCCNYFNKPKKENKNNKNPEFNKNGEEEKNCVIF